MGKYKALEQCKDYNILVGTFGDNTMEYFEAQLQKYLNSRGTKKYYPLIVQWWEGLIDTDDLLEEYKECMV